MPEIGTCGSVASAKHKNSRRMGVPSIAAWTVIRAKGALGAQKRIHSYSCRFSCDLRASKHGAIYTVTDSQSKQHESSHPAFVSRPAAPMLYRR